MLTADTLKGNWGTLLLPIQADDSIDFIRLSEEIDQLIGAGVDGIYSNGTAGEFHNQTEQEFDLIQVLLADKCHRAKMPFQIGVSHGNAVVSLLRIGRTVDLKPAAFQLTLPDWVAPQPEEQIGFLERMAVAAGNVPLVLYHPPHARTVLRPVDFERLRVAVPSLIGIKTGGGDGGWYGEMRRVLDRRWLSVFVPGHLLATGIREGVASGAYSNVACLSPRGAQAWWTQMNVDLPAALAVEQRIAEFFRICIRPYQEQGYSNPALDKFLAAVGGWAPIGTRLRWPYRCIDENDVPAARAVCERLLPEFFKSFE
jgi:dihydrodipicolinate synthase/N-acetylneuraminate lyase